MARAHFQTAAWAEAKELFEAAARLDPTRADGIHMLTFLVILILCQDGFSPFQLFSVFANSYLLCEQFLPLLLILRVHIM